VADLFPDVGFTVCVNSIHTDRNSVSLLKTRRASDDDDNDEVAAAADEEEQVESTTTKGKRKSTTDMEASNAKKRVAVCGLCGMTGSNKSSHYKENHGKKFVPSKAELAQWFESLKTDDKVGEDKAKKLARV